MSEFLCSHFNTEDGSKKHFLHIVLIISRKVKTIEMHKKICAVYGEGSVTDQTCQKCFADFHAGDYSLDNAPR